MPATVSARKPKKSTRRTGPSAALRDALAIAAEKGLLSGARTHIIRGRMPAALVKEAKRRSGITSDSKLLEAALANVAIADDYGEWLSSQRGTVSPDLDLEF